MALTGLAAVRRMIAENRRQQNVRLKAIFFDGLSEIIKETPVDEGRARNSWFFTEGMSFSLSSGRSDDTSGSGSFSSLGGMPDKILNKKLYFTNNVPYIETLEYGGYPIGGSGTKTSGGYSMQLIPFHSPKGWVRYNIIRMQNKVRLL
jgi:hypothetical protein